MYFIALDLETTGLDPHTDTIIEIAAIRFEIEKKGDSFCAVHIDERTMLVSPGRPLEENITKITGITNAMLVGKKTWKEIQTSVEIFIGKDAIIVGHNVLFDISMLETHGIFLGEHPILDTFELSEIFSQEAQSLNLGFLVDWYGIKKRGQEHRALTDTRASVDLFLLYLKQITTLSPLENALLSLGQKRETSPLLSLLRSICHLEAPDLSLIHSWKQTLTLPPQKTHGSVHSKTTKKSPLSLVSLSGEEKEEEIQLIEEMQKKEKQICILTQNKALTCFVSQRLETANISACIIHPVQALCSVEAVFDVLHTPKSVPRKKLILALKLAFWLTKTKTGLLEELKYYGPEYALFPFFQTQEDEWHIFRIQQQEQQKGAALWVQSIDHASPIDGVFPLFRDIALLEGPLRKAASEKIHFGEWEEDILFFSQEFSTQATDDFLQALHFLEGIYMTLPDRPKGVAPVPPGKYGETYFFSQKDTWDRGGKWLILCSSVLWDAWKSWKKQIAPLVKSHEAAIRFHRIEKICNTLTSFVIRKKEHTGCIITLKQGLLSLNILPSTLSTSTKKWFSTGIGYGYNIASPRIKDFLSKNFDLKAPSCQIHAPTHSYGLPYHPLPKTLPKGKTLILTTSAKHICEIGDLYATETHTKLLQGSSGGKAKMQHYFLEAEDALLVGTFHGWSNAFDLFKKSQTIIIAKIPFEVPTDSFFLARTHDIKNAFEDYSLPALIAILSTFIGEVHEINPEISLFCSDPRIQTSQWGKIVSASLS